MERQPIHASAVLFRSSYWFDHDLPWSGYWFSHVEATISPFLQADVNARTKVEGTDFMELETGLMMV